MRTSRPRPASAKLVARSALAGLARRLRSRRLRIAFANGCFDLLHPGHVALLESARRHGDVLVVGLNSDRSVRRLKGPGRPLLPQSGRARMLAALECVDYVTVFGEATPLKTIRLLAPHVLVKGADWKPGEIVGRAEVESWGGRIVRVRLEGGHSTSAILRRLRRR
jgi:D-beta-D-heptose 7-phosphate kinase/D-beta-D-heptose 1-phosphate adenosyltransferase